MITKNIKNGIGKSNTCFYCGFECNPSSQACGSCMRDATMYSSGMKINVPRYIKKKFKPKKYNNKKDNNKTI